MDLLRSFKDNCGFGLLASIDNIPTHQNVEDAIMALERMMHRGAIAADGKSGDGSGLLFGMPVEFMRKVAQQEGVALPEQFAVGMLFMQEEGQKQVIDEICEKNDLKVLLYREVPINTNALGEQALATLPMIRQIFLTPNSIIATKRFEALLYLTRREIEAAFLDVKDFYIPTFSNRVISYKGLVMPTHIKEFYPDLTDPDFKVPFALFHQRFSTNTLPEWRLAQPFRAIAHNGEINSISANRYNIRAKSEMLESDVFSESEIKRLLPITASDLSDSASLDNVFEFLVVNGMDFFKAARALIPAPWQNAPHMDSHLRAFYEYIIYYAEFRVLPLPVSVPACADSYLCLSVVVLSRVYPELSVLYCCCDAVVVCGGLVCYSLPVREVHVWSQVEFCYRSLRYCGVDLCFGEPVFHCDRHHIELHCFSGLVCDV